MENVKENEKVDEEFNELNGIMEYEYKRVLESGILDFGIEINTVKEKNYTEWNITMTAPEDSDYKGGKYTVLAKFEKDYPLVNPKFTFITDMYHCNVNDKKELNVNWLMKGMKIDYILPRLLTLFYLQDPTVDENYDKCKLYNSNKEEFMKNVKKNVEESKK